MNIEIKGCPFCGEIPEFFNHPSYMTIECINENCIDVSAYDYTFKRNKPDLINRWNKRKGESHDNSK